MKKFIRTMSIVLSILLLTQVVSVGAAPLGDIPAGQLTAHKSAAEGIPISGPEGEPLLSVEQAAEAGTGKATQEDNLNRVPSPIIGEVVELRDASTKHFRHLDGTFTVAVYADPVHYLDSAGKWQNIDNTLSLDSSWRNAAGRTTYTPNASGLDIRIPQDFSDGQMITIGKDGYVFGMGVKAQTNDADSKQESATTEEQPADAPVEDAIPAVLEELAASKAIDLSTVKAEVNNDLAADVEVAPEGESPIEAANARVMALDSLASAVTYRNIFFGADLIYHVTPSKLKEYISVNEIQDEYIYIFNLSLGGMIPVPQEDGSIYLLAQKDDEEPLFILEAPFMYDAAGEASTALKMMLAEDGTLTLTADAAWINDENRELPVTIDPTITTSATGIQDAYISDALLSGGTNYSNMTYNYAGKGLLGARRTYLRFTLPTLPDGSVVTGAALGLTQNSCDYYSSGKYLYLFDLTGKSSWSASSVTWNNQPVSKNVNGPKTDGTKIVDYATVLSGAGTYQFNITKAVKNWYENSNNNGFMITTSDEANNTQACLYGIACSTVSARPVAQIAYNTAIGLEDYWSFDSVDLGRSGTAYVNDYNGSLTYVHSDLAMTGNRLPISLGHVYNSNSNIYNTYYSGMYTGAKVHLNIQELLITISSTDPLYLSSNGNYRYKHYDADGTLHYYRLIGSAITHEYDEKLVVTTSGSDRIITDAQGNKKFFNSAGQLYKIQDNNGNTQTYTFSGNKITQVTDGAGRIATLGYNAYNQLASITDPAGRSTTFAYSSTATNANLTSITYPGNKTTLFQYVNTNHLSRVTAENNSYALFSYKSTAGCGYRVSYAYQYDKAGAQVDYLSFQYSITNTSGQATGNTVVTNKNGKLNRYLFDGFGRVTGVTNQDGQSQYSAYNSTVGNQFNKLKDSSDLHTISTNLLKNHGFEQTGYWTALQTTSAGSYGYVSGISARGDRSMKLQLTNNSGVFEIDQDFDGVAGGTYTVSVDINIPTALAISGNNGVFFGFVYCVNGGWYTSGSEWMASTQGWQRFSHTVTLPSGTLSNIHVFVELARTPGVVYFDNIQVEKSGGARLYNLVENSDFSNGTGQYPYCWTPSGLETADGIKTYDGRKFYGVGGSPSNAKKISQSVPVNAQVGDTLVIGGWAAAYATLDSNNTRRFGISVDIYSTASTKVATVPIDFDRSINMEFQTKSTFYTLTTPCHHIVYTFEYFYHVDAATFGNAFVYVGSFGEHYTYDNKGQPATTRNDDGELMEYTYSGTKLTDVDQTISGVKETVADIVYVPNTYNVQKITNNEGAKVEYTYTPYGQVASQSVTTATGEKIIESTTYYQNGNYPDTVTDARGGTTQYTYDLTKGLLTKVVDPNGNAITYTYDANTDELLSTTGKANPSTSVTTSFGMQDHLLKTITRNGMSYTNDYDNQNRVTALKAGSQTLVSNTYDSRRRLSQQTYANGAYYTPVYDSRDRQTGEKWNGVQTIEFFYNENDRLSQTVDKTTGVTYKFDYAFFGLLNKVTGSDGSLTAYDYDMSGKLSSLTFAKNGATIHEARYYTDEKGNPEDIILKSLGNTSLHYSYDGLGRLTGQSIGPVFTPIEYYAGAVNGSTTNLVQNYKNENGNGTALQNYTYTYDANGNITGVANSVGSTTTTYTYDGLNRLTGETGGGNAFVYNYDIGGNLTSITKNGSAVHSYTYGNVNWRDQLTQIDGNTITYDALGNPLTFNGYTFTWSKGRQLTGFVGNGLNIAYTYDASGHRIKQVANGTTINYTYSGDLLMRQSDGANTLDFQYDASGKAVGFMYNGMVYYYLRNLQGDVVAITDASSNVVGTYTYDAFGNVTAYSGAIASINPIRYRGYYQDPHTGWYFLNTRYYNPDWRRFINADAMFVAGNDALNASNMYAYCNGNPVMFADPSGKLIIAALAAWAVGNYHLGQNDNFRKAVDFAASIVNRIIEPAWYFILTGVTGIGSDFSTFSRDCSVGQKFFGTLDWLLNTGLYYADFVLAPLGNLVTGNCLLNPDWTKRVNDWGFGLQNLVWNFSMEYGARLGCWVLEFFPVSGGPEGKPNYATREGQYQWQHFMGYNWYYDFFFSAGGPIKKLTYDFESNGKHYIIWCWKADYWNLGPGAEIGIYVARNALRASRGFYDIDKKNLKIKTHMQVQYSGGNYQPPKLPYVASIQQTNWWITLFCPWVDQRIKNLDDLQVWQAVSFDIVGEYMKNENGDPIDVEGNVIPFQDRIFYIEDHGATHNNSNLFTAFKASDWDNKIAQGNEPYLKWGAVPNNTPPSGQGWDYLNLNGSYYGAFQFYIKF